MAGTLAQAARARPEGAPPAHLVLTDSGRTRFSKRFATEGATRMFYPHATRRPAIDAPKVAALMLLREVRRVGTGQATAHFGQTD
jgi:hypothetical protein